VTAPVGIAEIEETEGVELDAAMVPRETRRCACRAVQSADQVRHGDTECVPFALTAEQPAGYPAPEVTSRESWDGEEGLPGAVRKLAQKATAAGWEVRVQRSRGCLPDAANGHPSALKWLHAVIVRKGGANAYAIRDAETGTWKSVTTWGEGAPWFAGLASITDLGEYLVQGGMMPGSWYDEIRTRDARAEQRKKDRAECNKGLHLRKFLEQPEIPGPVRETSCTLCKNAWVTGAEPWRKPKTEKKDTAR
jgi:hypothetical protein